jgi:crotonobetaine/carnitine-CoA ligase
VSGASPWPDPAPGQARVDSSDIVSLALEACRRNPEVAVIRFEDGVEISRADFLAAVDRFAGWLHERVDPGDRVAIMMHNRIEFMVAWIAVAAKGAVLVSMNHDARRHDALHVLSDSGARVVLVDGECHGLVAELAPELPGLEHVVLVDGPEPRGLEPFAADAPGIEELRVDPDGITNVYYTSGTTGAPKGCMLGHDYWIRFAGLYLDIYGMSAEDRLLCCLQFFYGDPPWQLLASLRAGTTLIAMRRFSVSRFWRVVRENDVTQVFGLASIPALLLSAPPDPRDRDSKVGFGLQIGISKDLHAQMTERWGFPWMEGYGLTETGLVVGMPPADAERMTGSGSIGIPVPGAEVRLITDDGGEAPTGEPGEIWIKAPGLFKGYLNRPDATAEALVDGGWMRSGDLGRRDEEGYIYFLGRRKDIIRRSGENVAATEVEQVLRAHPSVLEAAVIAVPDELRGEEVKAYVALVEGETPETVPPQQLIEHCAAELATYKVPRYIAYQEEFPRTPSMRVRKSELIAEVDDLTVGAWDREDVIDPSQRR